MDCILVDPAYNGQVFHVAWSMCPSASKTWWRAATGCQHRPQGSTVAVKIIDMLGEELVVTLSVSWCVLPSASLGVAGAFCYKIVAASA